MKVVRILFYLAGVCVLPAGNCQPVVTPPPNPTGPMPTWDAAKFPWPMYAQNVRRTGQSPHNGPATATPSSPRNWGYPAVGGAAINMQAVVTDAGVYFGTWGVLRRNAGAPPESWDKSDGHWYGLHLDNRGSASAQQIFAPLNPALTQAGYLDPARPKLSRDVFWMGSGNDYLVSFYNGTIEGTPVIDPDDGTHYLGRGDGRLFAINPATGTVKWTFETFNPQAPSSHDSGGEIVGGPVMGPGKIIYFGTWAAPWPGSDTEPGYETNAVYAVDTLGRLVWRYPSQGASLDNLLAAPPALSPDGMTLYVATTAGDVLAPGRLIALDLTQPADAPDDRRLKWELVLRNAARDLSVWVKVLAVDLNGVIYCGGSEPQLFSTSPVVFAVRDLGDHGAFVWNPVFTEPHGYPSSAGRLCNGLAIREVNGVVDRLYATTTHVGRNNGTGGALFAVNPADGAIQHTFDPDAAGLGGIGGMTAPTIGANGVVYVGSRGQMPAGATPSVNGRVYGLNYDPATGFHVLWQFEAQGQIDWAHPTIGANGALYFGTTDLFAPVIIPQWFAPADVPPDRSPIFYGLFE